MSGAFGYNQSSQDSRSNSGLSGQYKEWMNEKAFNRNEQVWQAANNAYNNPWGTFQGKTGAQMLGLDSKTGLPPAFSNYLNQAAGQMFANASAGGALRGQVTQDNTQGIVGNAITNLGAAALPYVSEWQKMAAAAPEQALQQRLGYLQAATGNDVALLGGSSSYGGSSFGFNVSGGMGVA